MSMKRVLRKSRIWLFAFCLLATVAETHGQHDVIPVGSHKSALWIGDVGSWSNVSNWSCFVVPGSKLGSRFVEVNGQFPVDLPRVYLDIDVTIRGFTLGTGGEMIVQPGNFIHFDTVLSSSDLVNAGSIQLTADGLSSGMILDGAGTLAVTGGGTIVLGNQFLTMLRGHTGDERLLIEDQSIGGEGAIGNGLLELVNEENGRLFADVTSRSLHIWPNDKGISNRGVIEAENGGWLIIDRAFVHNDDGLLHVGDGSFIDIDDSIIVGGTMQSSGSGLFRSMSYPARLQHVHNLAHYMIGPIDLTLHGEIVNDGLIDVVGDLTLGFEQYFSSRILMDGGGQPVTLSGTGTLSLLQSVVRPGDDSFFVELVNEADHVIAGRGMFGSGAVTIVNHGQIVADQPGTLFFNLSPIGGLTNHGELRASNGGFFNVTTGSFNNQGRVVVLPGSLFQLGPMVAAQQFSSGFLLGGQWEIDGRSDFAKLCTGNRTVTTSFGDVTLRGKLVQFTAIDSIQENLGGFHVKDGHHFATNAHFVNAGDLTIGADSVLEVNGTLKLLDGGELKMQYAAGTDPYGYGAACGLIQVNGTVQLGGRFVVHVDDGVVGVDGAQQIIFATNVAGAFDDVELPDGFQLIISSNGIVLQFSDDEDDFEGRNALPTDKVIELIQAINVAEPVESSSDFSDITAESAKALSTLLKMLRIE